MKLTEKMNQLFLSIDQKTFRGVDQFKQSTVYTTISQKLSSLSDNQLRLVASIITGGLIVIPSIILLFALATNLKLSQHHKIYGEISQKLLFSKEAKIKFNQQNQDMISPINATTLTEFKSDLTQMLPKKSLAISQFDVTQFDDLPGSLLYRQLTATITFKNLGFREWNNFIEMMTQHYRGTIEELTTNRIDSQETLDGSIVLRFIANQPAPEQSL